MLLRIAWIAVVAVWIGGVCQAGDDFEPAWEDTLAELLQLLCEAGPSGELTRLELPAKVYSIAAESAEAAHYAIERRAATVELQGWTFQDGTLTARKVILHQPALVLYQGTPESIEDYLKRLPIASTKEISSSTGSSQQAVPSVQVPGSVRIEHVEVQRGTLLAVDTLASPTRRVLVQDVAFSVENLILPDQEMENTSGWNLDFVLRSPVPGRGRMSLLDTSRNGNYNFTFSCNVDSLDLGYLSPFIPLEGGWQIEKGIVGLVVDGTCVNNLYNSYNLLKLKDLKINPGSQDSQVKDAALKAILSLGSSVYGDVALDFTVSGDLTDPEFDLGSAYEKALQDALVRWSTLQALRKIGLQDNTFLRERLGVDADNK